MKTLNCNIFYSMERVQNTDILQADSKIALVSATGEKGMSIAMLSFNKDREFQLRIYTNDANGSFVMITDEISQDWEGLSDSRLTSRLLRFMDDKIQEFELSDDYEEERQ